MEVKQAPVTSNHITAQNKAAEYEIHVVISKTWRCDVM